jgi:hypothetical protein
MNTRPLLTTEVAIIGASLGGVMAAWQACALGRRVVLVAEHKWLGGQMTAQAVPPDEHPAIERGGASASYLAFRAAIRAHYRADPDFDDHTSLTEGCNPGDGWVSRLCFAPDVAAAYFEALLVPYVQSGMLVLLRDSQLQSVERGTKTRIDAVEVSSGSANTKIVAALFLDATDTGRLIKLAGLKYRIGKEARDEFAEPAAPERADKWDQQPVTYVMALRLHPTRLPVIEPPRDYIPWRDHIVPHYGHRLFSTSMPGAGIGQSTALPLFAQGSTLDWWRYRRIVAAHQWRRDGLPVRLPVSLINWAQNDYTASPLLDGPRSEAEVVDQAKNLSRAWLYWLQTEAPRDDGRGSGYPELQLATDMLGTDDGFAQQVYVRESRRLVGRECLSQADIQYRGGPFVPTAVANSVGTVWYNMDIHPTCVSGHGLNARVRPFCLPLGVFVPTACENLLPACKNISVTHLVNAATRVHPAEWLIGEVAGLLAHQVILTGVTPQAIHASARETKNFQQLLTTRGIPLDWPPALLAGLEHHHQD